MKPGISTYTYTWSVGVPGKEPQEPMTIYQLLEKTVQNGLPVLQVADNMPLHQFSNNERDSIRNDARDKNIAIEVGTKRLDEQNLEQYLDIAHDFYSPFLRVVIDDNGYEPPIDHVIRIINNSLSSFKSRNIKLALENHDRFTSRQFIDIIEKTDADWVGICLDSVNSMGAGEGLETVIENLAPYTINLHVKEFTVKRVYHKMGFVVEGMPLGQGRLPMVELISKISKRCKSAILEQWVPPAGSLEQTITREHEWASRSIHALKQLLNYD